MTNQEKEIIFNKTIGYLKSYKEMEELIQRTENEQLRKEYIEFMNGFGILYNHMVGLISELKMFPKYSELEEQWMCHLDDC